MDKVNLHVYHTASGICRCAVFILQVDPPTPALVGWNQLSAARRYQELVDGERMKSRHENVRLI